MLLRGEMRISNSLGETSGYEYSQNDSRREGTSFFSSPEQRGEFEELNNSPQIESKIDFTEACQLHSGKREFEEYSWRECRSVDLRTLELGGCSIDASGRT